MREIKMTKTAAMSKIISAVAVSLLAIVASFGAASPASAAPVDSLDLHSLSSPHGGWGAEVWASAKNSTGQLAVLIKYHPQGGWYDENRYAIEKFNSDASLDTSFGTNGVVDLPYESGHDLQILSNDRILVAGGYYDWSRAEIRVARVDVFQNDGSNDTSFGTNGHQDIAGASVGGDSYPDIRQVTSLPNGKLAVLLNYRNFNREYQYVQVFQIRNTDGSLDQGYGQSGEIELTAPAGARELETQSFTVSDTEIVVNVSYKTEPDTRQCMPTPPWYPSWFPPMCYNVPAPSVPSTITVQYNSSVKVGNPASAPKIYATKSGNGKVTLGVTAPKNNGGTAIKGYEYTLNDGATWSATGLSRVGKNLVITGLTNGTNYTVKVRAVNGFGGGAASNASNFKPRTVAGAPVITDAIGLNRSIQLSFTAPASNGGSEIVSYYCSINGQKWHYCFDANTTNPVISGIKNGISYSIKIRALNAVGSSVESNTVQATPKN